MGGRHRALRAGLALCLAAGACLVWAPRAAAFSAAGSAPGFPKGPPDDPDYAPAEVSPPPCSTVSVNDEQFYLYSFLPRCATTAKDPQGASGMSVDRAWAKYTTGSPDTVIAYVEGGINWHASDVRELVDKVYLNMGELPVPCKATGPCITRHSDKVSDYDLDHDHDGVVDASDYASDPRVHDVNGNGVIDPEDVIAAFSCYDKRTETIGKASWPSGQLHCSNGAAGVDNDHNGYAHDISGWDFYDNQNDPATVDGAYGHANDQMRQAAAQTNNALLGAGICPRCMILPIKAGAEAIDGPVQLAEAWMYAADAGASVIVSVTADAAHSSVLADALKYVESKGVVVVEASNDFDSVDHQGGMYWPGVLPGNSLVANSAGVSGPAIANSRTTTFRARSDETSWGPHNVFSVPTQGGSTSEATPTLGAIVALLLSWGKEAAARHLISSPLTGPEAVQVLRSTASPVNDPTLAWPGAPGWSEQYGYGRPDVAAAMEAVAKGRVPPTCSIDSPEWYSLFDPTTVQRLVVTGQVQAPRSSHYRWVLQAGLGAQPTRFWTLGQGAGSAAHSGRLGVLDLGRVPRSFWDAPYALSATKELTTAEQYAVTLRLRVYDAQGLMGEDRRVVYIHHDPSLLAGFPIKVGHGGESQPALADLQGRGRLAIIFGDSDGLIHAIDPATRRELPGWPAHTDPVHLARAHPGVDPGFEPVVASVAVGDLDHDGHLWVVATSVAGKVYVFSSDGRLRPGWPRALNTGVVPPPVPRPDLPHTRLPTQAALASPVLYDLAGDGRLDVIQAGWDGYLHAWAPDGTDLPGWPVRVAPPPGFSPDPGYVLVNDSNLVATPAIAYLGSSQPAVVERAQFTEIPAAGPLPTSPFSFYFAYGPDGRLLPGWPAKVTGTFELYGTAQQFVTEGASSPVSAPVDGSGTDQVVADPVFSPATLLGPQGTPLASYGSEGAAFSQLASVIAADGTATSSPVGDEPLGFTTSGAFGKVGGQLVFTEAGTGAQSLGAALYFPGSGNPLYNYLRAYGAQSANPLAGFPVVTQGLAFLSEPLVVPVDPGGQTGLVLAGDSGAVEAYDSSGALAPGFPKFDGGWMLWSLTAGDLLSDGHTDLVGLTREGYLFAWRTSAPASANDQWWTFHHDEWRTGRYGTDTRPPGAIRHLTWSGDRTSVSFEAPGGDWYSGEVEHYLVTIEFRSGQTVSRTVAPSGPAGTRQVVELGGRAAAVGIQAVDEAGNLGPKLWSSAPR